MQRLLRQIPAHFTRRGFLRANAGLVRNLRRSSDSIEYECTARRAESILGHLQGVASSNESRSSRQLLSLVPSQIFECKGEHAQTAWKVQRRIAWLLRWKRRTVTCTNTKINCAAILLGRRCQCSWRCNQPASPVRYWSSRWTGYDSDRFGSLPLANLIFVPRTRTLASNEHPRRDKHL